MATHIFRGKYSPCAYQEMLAAPSDKWEGAKSIAKVIGSKMTDAFSLSNITWKKHRSMHDELLLFELQIKHFFFQVQHQGIMLPKSHRVLVDKP